MKEKIQIVIDTLQELTIPSSYDNMRKLLGCINELADIQRSLPPEEEPKIELIEFPKEEENGAAE